MRICLYRKISATPTKRPTKAAIAALEFELALSRVHRDDLVAFITSGTFHKLPALPAHVVKNPALRRRDHGSDCYVLTLSDLGRAQSSPQTIAMSVRQWIEKYLVASGLLAHDEFAIVIEE